MNMQRLITWGISIGLAAGLIVATVGEGARAAETVPVGTAKIDITPDSPVRLVGYAGRKGEFEGVAQRIWAKALAIGSDEGDGPAVLVTVDNCGVPDNVVEEVASRLKKKTGLKRERLAICATHTHTAPWLDGFLPWHYAGKVPAEHRQHIRQYTEQLTDRIEQVALDALAARKPGQLAWAQGSVAFAANRRVIKNGKWAGFGVNPKGPVDHSLPLLRVTDTQGKLVALLVNYACHGTTLTGRHNQIHGDWQGCAQQYIEADHPGAIALVSTGCGADANPEPRGQMEMTEKHGRAVADEVNRLLDGKLTPVSPKLTARLVRIELPFGELPTLEEVRRRVANSKPGTRGGDHARDMLARLERGESLPAALNYPVEVWAFGDDLAMVFLAGEVVADYSLRLKRELDGSRIWVTAYANDEPCYIVTRRLLEEGGYEVDSSMISYGHPTRFSPAVEDKLVNTVKKLIPQSFTK